MRIQILEDRLLQYISLNTNKHCLTSRLTKHALKYGFKTLAPAQQSLLNSTIHYSCEDCKCALIKEDRLIAYQEKKTLNRILCEDCRTILQITG